MALTEKLQLIIDADGKGAVRGLESVGAAADRNLGKTDDRLARVGAQLTSFGTATVAAAAVAGAGLYKVAQSASAYGEQVSRATKVFGDEATPELEAFADSAAETAGISKTAALQAASNFAAFGRQAGLTGNELSDFSQVLVQSAGDFASLNDIPVDEAILAFGSALSGEAEPLKRFGVDVSDAAVQAYALENGIGGATGAVTQSEKVMARYGILMQEGALWAGDFADTSDSLGNRQKQLAADFENAKVALGQGLLPIAEGAIGIVQGLAERFDNLSDSQQQAIGKFAGWAVVGAGVVGSLSLVAGQVIKMRDAFTTVTGSGDNATRSLNKFGQAAKGVGIAAGVVGGLLVLDGVLDGLTDRTEEFKTSLDELAAAKSAEQSLAALLAAAEASESGWESFRESMNPIPKQLTTVGVGANAVTFDLGNLEEAMSAAAEAGQMEQLQQGIDQLYALSAASGQALPPEVIELLATFQARINAAGAAADAAAGGVDAAGGAFDGMTGSTEDATSALQDYADTLKGMLDPQFAAVDAMKGLQEAQVEIVEATAEVNKLQAEGKTGTAEYAEAVAKLEEAQFGAVKAASDQEAALLDLAISLDENGDSTEDVVASLRTYGQQAGLTVDQTNAIIAEFLIATGAAKELGAQHPKPTADADTQPFWSKLIPANQGADTFGGLWKQATLAANSDPFWREIDRVNNYSIPPKSIQLRATGAANLPSLFNIGRHSGGLVSPAKTYIVGEQGPEVFTPATAGSITANHDLGNHFGGGGGGGGTVYNINVAAGLANPAETGRAVVDAIRSYERVNGQNWRN